MRCFNRPSLRPAFRAVCWATALLALPMNAGARAAPTEISLDEVRRHAAASAPIVAARSARVDAARADAARADALPDPELNIGIDNLSVTGANAFRLGADDMTQRRIGVTQAWPSRPKREARRARAEAQLGTAVDEVAATRLAVEQQAGEAWIAAWAADAEVRFLQTLIGDTERAADIAEVQLANATGTAADALTAQLARAELDNAMRRAQAQRRAAQAGLARWIKDDARVMLAPMPNVAQLRVPADRLRASLDQQAELQVWRGRQREAAAAISLAQAERRPDLGFALSYGARSAGLPDMMMFEVSVSLPLFARDRQDHDLAARRAEYAAVAAEHEEARRARREALEQLLANWEGTRDELARYRDLLLPLARDRSATALAGYAGGGGIEPWIEAREGEIASARRALQLQADLARAWLALDTRLPRAVAAEVQP